jgi:hypothetical protein
VSGATASATLGGVGGTAGADGGGDEACPPDGSDPPPPEQPASASASRRNEARSQANGLTAVRARETLLIFNVLACLAVRGEVLF